MAVNTVYYPAFIMAFCLLFLPISAHAESNTAGTNQASTQQIITPGKGLSMLQVESRFGSPAQKLPPTGTPPITRWKYEGFTVYFDSEFVIHSVIHH